MCMRRSLFALAAVLASPKRCARRTAIRRASTSERRRQPQELAQFFAIPPDGAGCRTGSGTNAGGQKVYADSCAAMSRRQASRQYRRRASAATS